MPQVGVNPYSSAHIAIRRLAMALSQSAFSMPGPVDQSRPVADPQLQLANTLYSFQHAPSRLLEGVITDTAVTAYAYRVQLPYLHTPIICYSAAHGAFGAFGARSLQTYVAGTRVLVALDPQRTYGWIIGVIPPFGRGPEFACHQQLLGTTRQRVDYAHLRPLLSSNENIQIQVPSATAGRLLDATTAGEYGFITETGLRIFIDSFMAMFGLDEANALTFFHADQLARLAAYNYQFWTAGCEQEAMDDQGEYNDWIGYTPYPWEQLGLYTYRMPALRDLSAQQWQSSFDKEQQQKGQPWNFRKEPINTHQMPWHRYREFRGYLGQGHKRIVQLPPQDVSSSQTSQYVQLTAQKPETVHPLVFSETVLLDGSYLLESAKQIAIVKRIGGVSPARTRRPEQPAAGGFADEASVNYRAAGLGEAGEEHKIASTPNEWEGAVTLSATPPSPVSLQQQLAAIYDLHTYLFNYAGVHPFHWHRNDWYTPEAEDMTFLDGAAIDAAALGLERLYQQQYLSTPSSIQLEIDHRYGRQYYYKTQAGIHFADDGSVVIYDGFGSEIRMSQGMIYIDPAADLFMRSGRNIIQWAGHDVHIRARDSVDIVASRNDIRIKAENNLQLLGGNSGFGGVLIESKSTNSAYDFSQPGEQVQATGIMIRAATDIVTWSDNIYLRTGGGSEGQAGVIVLDAGKGLADVVVQARIVSEFLQSAHLQFFGTDGEFQEVNQFARGGSVLNGSMLVGESLVVGRFGVFGNSILVADGTIATSEAKEDQLNYVTPLTGDSLRQASEAVQEIGDISNDLLSTGSSLYRSEIRDLFYQTAQAGTDDVIDEAHVTFRSTAEYGGTAFVMYETRWQQLARMANASLPAWQEVPIIAANGESYPYPGEFTTESLLVQPLQLVTAGVYKKRATADGGLAEEYASGFAEAQAKTLNDYTITGSSD